MLAACWSCKSEGAPFYEEKAKSLPGSRLITRRRFSFVSNRNKNANMKPLLSSPSRVQSTSMTVEAIKGRKHANDETSMWENGAELIIISPLLLSHWGGNDKKREKIYVRNKFRLNSHHHHSCFWCCSSMKGNGETWKRYSQDILKEA